MTTNYYGYGWVRVVIIISFCFASSDEDAVQPSLFPVVCLFVSVCVIVTPVVPSRAAGCERIRVGSYTCTFLVPVK